MVDTAQAAQTIANFLQTFTSSGNLKLRFRVKVRGTKPAEDSYPEAAGENGARDLYVEFTGPDTQLLVARNGELLNALEHIATKMLRLDSEEHHRVSFDADHFKADRDRQLQQWAQTAIERVRATGRPHSFPPMSSRERRALHLLLAESGLPTASSGEGPNRFVVLYPEGEEPGPMPQPRRPDPNQIRHAFRHR